LSDAELQYHQRKIKLSGLAGYLTQPKTN